MEAESWAGSIDLSTRAAELLKKLVAALPQNREFTITVFGSAPLQICVDLPEPSSPSTAMSRPGKPSWANVFITSWLPA